MEIKGPLVDGVDQDQTVRNVQSDLGSMLPDKEMYPQKIETEICGLSWLVGCIGV